MNSLAVFFAAHSGFSLATITALLHALILLAIFVILTFGGVIAVTTGRSLGSIYKQMVKNKQALEETAKLCRAYEVKISGPGMGPERFVQVDHALAVAVPWLTPTKRDELIHAVLFDMGKGMEAFASAISPTTTVVQGDQINTPVSAPSAQSVQVDTTSQAPDPLQEAASLLKVVSDVENVLSPKGETQTIATPPLPGGTANFPAPPTITSSSSVIPPATGG